MTLSLEQATIMIADLQESIAELEQLAREDRGWDILVSQVENDMTPDGRRAVSDLCEMMTIVNPLIRRGFKLRHSYIWGGGRTIAADRGEADTEGLVNNVVQTMLDDPRNSTSLNSEEAAEGLERWLYTHGAVVLLCHTETDGSVVVRQEDPDHITDRIADPEDSRTIWYWKREYQVRNIRADGTPGAYKTVTVWHPDIDFHPLAADKLDKIGKHEVRWHQPLLVRTVNTPASAAWSWGFPDCYAAVPWARMSKEFLESWFVLMKALSRYAWRTSTKSPSARRTIPQDRTMAQVATNSSGAGSHAIMDPGTTLEAIPKSGATIDASSAQPIQQYVAAALDVPITMLLGDPGVTGARATAETLDQPMENAMWARRRFWSEVFDRICSYAIEAAVDAGTLAGTVIVEGNRRKIELPDGFSRNVNTEWPAYDSTPIDVMMKAIRDADGLDKLPVEVIVRLALQALGVPDIDEVLDSMRNAAGDVEGAAELLQKAPREDYTP